MDVNVNLLKTKNNCRLYKHSGYYDLMNNIDIFEYDKVMISLAKFANLLGKFDIPYINNYKLFLNESFKIFTQEVISKTVIEKFILLCLQENNVNKTFFQNVNNANEFNNAMSIINITSKDEILLEAQHIFKEYSHQIVTISFSYLYSLYAIIATAYLQNLEKKR